MKYNFLAACYCTDSFCCHTIFYHVMVVCSFFVCDYNIMPCFVLHSCLLCLHCMIGEWDVVWDRMYFTVTEIVLENALNSLCWFVFGMELKHVLNQILYWLWSYNVSWILTMNRLNLPKFSVLISFGSQGLK